MFEIIQVEQMKKCINQGVILQLFLAAKTSRKLIEGGGYSKTKQNCKETIFNKFVVFWVPV